MIAYLSNTSHLQAEEQNQRPEDAVRTLAAASSADPRHSKYHLDILRRAVATIDGAPAASTERHERRVYALQLCMNCVVAGGCTKEEPFEMALRLLEVEEEVAGSTLVTGLARKAAAVAMSCAERSTAGRLSFVGGREGEPRLSVRGAHIDLIPFSRCVDCATARHPVHYA